MPPCASRIIGTTMAFFVAQRVEVLVVARPSLDASQRAPCCRRQRRNHTHTARHEGHNIIIMMMISLMLSGVGLVLSGAAANRAAIQAASEGARQAAGAEPPFYVIQTAQTAQAFLDQHDAFLFDCDGVLWRGEDGLLPGTVETIALLERLGKTCVFVTNNAAKSRAAYAKKFAGLGLENISMEQVVPSSFVAARWLAKNKPSVACAFVIGADGLCDELREAGVRVLTARDFDFPGADPSSNEASASLALLAEAVAKESSVGAVVVGHDTGFNFKALCLASLFLEREGTCFIATNPDAYDVVSAHRMPGNGCFVAAVSCVAGRSPDAVCGKPARDLADYLVATFALDPSRTCMIGDRLDTDIALATAGSGGAMSSLLVLTGVTTADTLLEEVAQQAAKPSSSSAADSPPGVSAASVLPTHVISHVGQLLELAEGSKSTE